MSESTSTEEELSALSDKLQAWGEAEGEEPEVAGFSFTGPPISTQLGDFSRIALSPLSPSTNKGDEKW